MSRERIRDAVEALDEVRFALLFGSRAGEARPRPSSDWDVAVYVDNGLDSPAQIQGWAGLRNVLTHLYLEIDHRRLHAILTGELDVLERYAAALARVLEG